MAYSNNDDIITLTANDGEEIDFYEIAGINYRGKFYAILQPVELLDGMSDDEALVFGVTRNGGNDTYHIELDDKIVDGVFKEYNKLLKKQNNGGKKLRASRGMGKIFGATKALARTTINIVRLLFSIAFTLTGIALIVAGIVARVNLTTIGMIIFCVIGLVLVSLGVRGFIKFKNRKR